MKITPKFANPQAHREMGFMDAFDEYFWRDIGPRSKLLILEKQALNVKAAPIYRFEQPMPLRVALFPGRGSSNGVLL